MPRSRIYNVATNRMISWIISDVCCTVLPPNVIYVYSFVFLRQHITFAFIHASMVLESAWVGTGHGDAAGANLGNAVLRFAVLSPFHGCLQ